ncbi:hypothetical protein H9P43_003117 [Blastocladiella emersonii ATCC 22665]|nr:hypothetical protein H9P43_003117 [Blastocladiella emersonii ATCC 22665]
MLDHLYGKPSTTWKRFEALLVALVSLKILKAYHNRPAPGGRFVRGLDAKLKRFAPWQIVLGTLTSGYLLSKFSLFTFMNSTEPYARYYNRNFYRATWIMVALDAGFWTAMNIKPKILRDVCSILFTLFYLVFANRADYKVRRLRASPTLDMMRLSWEKQRHPLFRLASRAMQPKITWRGKRVELPRPPTAYGYNPADPNTTRTVLSLFFAGAVADLAHVRNVILHFPGGGFVCMDPSIHEDYLVEWAHLAPHTLVVAVDYAKAPEYPYPYAHEELFELYKLIRETNGECLGLAGWTADFAVTTVTNGRAAHTTERRRCAPIVIAMSGDSAGGNLAAGVVTRCIEAKVPLPDSLVLIYPHLDIDMACWLSPQTTELLRVESAKHVNAHVDIHRTASVGHLSQLHLSALATTTAAAAAAAVSAPTSPRGLGPAGTSSGVLDHSAPMSSLSINTNMDASGSSSSGGGLQRKRSFFEMASSKLSALRTQKPHTVFDDYGNPTSAHPPSSAIDATPTGTGTATPPPPKSPYRGPSATYPLPPSTGGPAALARHGGATAGSTLALTSHMANFNDRVLTPETMRALALLYLGPSPIPIDLERDYYLSPVRTPDAILAQFPKTYLVCGEKDPLVDDTITMAGRIREAKQRAWHRSLGRPRPRDTDVAEVVILEGVSHAVLQMMAFLPEAKDTCRLIHGWFNETFHPAGEPAVAKMAAAAAQQQARSTTSATMGSRTTSRSKFTIGADHEGLHSLVGSNGSAGSSFAADDASPQPTVVHRTQQPRSRSASPVRPSSSSSNTPTPRTATATSASQRPKLGSAHVDEEVSLLTGSEADDDDDDDDYLEFRDQAHVDQARLLQRRTMHLSHGLFGSQEQADKAFRQKIGTGTPTKRAASTTGTPSGKAVAPVVTVRTASPARKAE